MARLKQRDDGRYVCKYKGRCFYGSSQREAQKKRDEYRRMIESGMSADYTNITVRQYAHKWIKTHKAAVSDKCYNDYAKQLNVLLDFVGDIRIIDVTPDDIKQVFSTHYLNYSQSTIKRARMLYISMFDAAVENGYARINPCRSKYAQPHRGTVGTHRAISNRERDLILKTPHRFRLGAMLMLYAGLRRGEVLALRLSDIDTEANIIHVTKAVRFESNQPIMGRPKSDAGIRDVPLLSQLAKEIPKTGDYLMPSASGTTCSDMAFKRGWDSYMHTLSEAAGCEINIRPHDLRHSYCTMLRDAGVEMKLAMQWMGHADERMILRIYDHITTDRVEKSVRMTENQINGSQNGSQTRFISRRSR